jgi:uncharacterized protein
MLKVIINYLINLNQMLQTVIEITVIPKSSRHEIIVDDNNNIRAYLNTPPMEGKANEACIKLFAKTLKVSKSSISIQKGLKSKKKHLVIQGLGLQDIIQKIRK